MRISSKGQVTVPADIRRRAGLLPGAEVEVLFDGVVVQLRLVASRPEPGRGERLLAHLRGKGSLKMTTDEIMSLTRGDD